MSGVMPGMDESLALIASVLVRAESEGHVPRAVVALESIAESLKHLANAPLALKDLADVLPTPSSELFPFPLPSPSVPAVRYGTCVECDLAAVVNSEGWCAVCFSHDPAAVRNV